MYDYFYGPESEQFSFYRIPKVLFTAERFRGICVEAKVLYGLLLDRMSLSAKNGWLDGEGRVFIVFTIEEIMEAMGCGDQKAGKLLTELEKKCGLIERKRQGLGKPNLIYVKNFVTSPESPIQKGENHDSGDVNITNPEPLKSRCNNTELSNTELSNTEFSDTDSFPFPSVREAKGMDGRSRAEYREVLMENIGYEVLIQDFPQEQDTLSEILELMVDTVCSTRRTIRISGDEKPAEVVHSQFLKLTSEHIRFVLESLQQNTTRVRNMRQYLLATLYNAPLTMGNYYRSLVNHDLSGGEARAG